VLAGMKRGVSALGLIGQLSSFGCAYWVVDCALTESEIGARERGGGIVSLEFQGEQ
jgi:hypothetical protein